MVNAKRSVVFVDDKNTTHIFDGRATDILWPAAEEFERNRNQARTDGRRLRREGFGKILDGCFNEPKEDVQRKINEFVKRSDGRGVERFACKSLFDERKQDRTKAIQAVLIGQKQGRDKNLPVDMMQQQLREVSLVFCLNAKVFARRLGKADEAACYPKQSKDKSSSAIQVAVAASAAASKTALDSSSRCIVSRSGSKTSLGNFCMSSSRAA